MNNWNRLAPVSLTREYPVTELIINLPIIQVVAKNGEEVDVNEAAFTDVATGVLINSDFINGLEVKEAKEKMIEFLTEKGIGNARGDSPLSVGI